MVPISVSRVGAGEVFRARRRARRGAGVRTKLVRVVVMRTPRIKLRDAIKLARKIRMRVEVRTRSGHWMFYTPVGVVSINEHKNRDSTVPPHLMKFLRQAMEESKA